MTEPPTADRRTTVDSPGAVLPPIDHRRRVERVVDAVRDGGEIDVLLVTDLVDVRWLTGFTGSHGWVVVTADEVTLGTDGRYRERAAAETAQAGITVFASTRAAELSAHRDRLLAGLRVGVDVETVTHGQWEQLAAGLDVVATASPVRPLRWRKDDAEIVRMELAAAAASAALAEVEPLLAAGDGRVTEADVRNELEYRMRLQGADDRSYATIVATGPEHAARPHHEVNRRPIVAGDTVVIDVGGLVDGYHSDMTRSWVIGEPTTQQREIYELVATAERAGVAAVGDGVPASAVDAVCRSMFTEAGYGDWYLHGTGHGVGLEIHEPPFLSVVNDSALVAGNVVTVEPGLYRDGFGGFRVEDLVVVTSDGCRLLTHHPYAPFGE